MARANLADIENRMAEQRGRLESQQKAELATMDAAHRRQELKLEERIQNAYDRREREGWKEQERARETANDGRQQERAGPEPGNGSRERGGREFG